MRIQCEILDVDGQPADAPSISVSIRNNNSSEPVDIALDEQRFEVWLPISQPDDTGGISTDAGDTTVDGYLPDAETTPA